MAQSQTESPKNMKLIVGTKIENNKNNHLTDKYEEKVFNVTRHSFVVSTV